MTTCVPRPHLSLTKRLFIIPLLVLLFLSSISFIAPPAQAKKPEWAVPGVYLEYEQGIRCHKGPEFPRVKYTFLQESDRVLKQPGPVGWHYTRQETNEQQGVYVYVTTYPSDWQCPMDVTNDAFVIEWDKPSHIYYSPALARQQGLEFVKLREPILGRAQVFIAKGEGYTQYFDAPTGVLLWSSGSGRVSLKLVGSNLQWPTDVEREVCKLTITPTLPPATRPLQTVRPNGDRAEYRIGWEWTGPDKTASISWRISPDPQAMKALGMLATSPPSVSFIGPKGSALLHIETHGAPADIYVITLVATLKFKTGENCSSKTDVLLEVTKDRSEVPLGPLFPKVGRVNTIQGHPEGVRIINVTSGVGSTARIGNELRVGHMLQTGSDPNTIIGIQGKDGTIQLWSETATIFVGIEVRANPDETKRITVNPPVPPPYISNFNPDWDKGLEPAFVPILIPVGHVWKHIAVVLIEGTLHFAGRFAGELFSSEQSEGTIPDEQPRWGSVITPTAVITSRGTEFTVKVASNGATTVTTLGGGVVATDLTSRKSVIVKPNEQLTIPKTPTGLGEQKLQQSVTPIDPKTLERWWEIKEVSPTQPQPPAKEEELPRSPGLDSIKLSARVLQGRLQITNPSGVKSEATMDQKVPLGDVLRTGTDDSTIIGITTKEGVIHQGSDTIIALMGIEQRTREGVRALGIVPRPPLSPSKGQCEGLPQCEKFYGDLRHFDMMIFRLGVLRGILPVSATSGLMLYLHQGSLHVASGENREGENRIDAILTPYFVIAHRGAEFTVDVSESFGWISVKVMGGTVEVMDWRSIRSGSKVSLDSNQELWFPGVGESKTPLSQYVRIFNPNRINRWWVPFWSLDGVVIPLATIITLVGAAGLVVFHPRKKYALTPYERFRPRNLALFGFGLSIASFISAILGIELDLLPNSFTMGFPLLITIFFGLILLVIVAPIKLVLDRRRKAHPAKPETRSTAGRVKQGTEITIEPEVARTDVFCRYCGTRLPGDSKFCSKCGRSQ